MLQECVRNYIPEGMIVAVIGLKIKQKLDLLHL